MYFEVRTAQYIDKYSVSLAFEDSSSGIVDLSSS